MVRSVLAFSISLLLAGCAGGPPPQTPAPLQQWIGMPFDSVQAVVGAPSGSAGYALLTEEMAASARGETGYVWIEGECRVKMYFSKAMLVEYGTLAGDCSNDAMIAAGWFEKPRQEGIKASYAKFFQTYRAWTNAVEVTTANTLSTLELTFIGGFNKNKPEEIASVMLIRLVKDQRSPRSSQRDETGIPISVFQNGEARLLLNDSDVYSIQASQEIPINLAASGSENFLVLDVSPGILHRIGRAHSVDILLPSGTEFSLPADYMEYVRNLAALLDRPDVLIRFADTGKMN